MFPSRRRANVGFPFDCSKGRYTTLFRKSPIHNFRSYLESGPYETKKAYDLLVQCETGVVSVTGTEEEPAKTGIPVADIASGMYAFSGVLAALVKRFETGEGSHVEVSMLEALGEWMGYPMYFTEYGGIAPQRTGARHAAIAPYGPFEVAEGKQIFLSVQNDREWRVLAEEVLKQPQLIEDPRFKSNMDRVHNSEDLRAVIEAMFKTLDIEEVQSLLESSGIANAQLRSPKDFVDHPQLKARDRWMTIPTSEGSIKALKPVITIDEEPSRTDPVPELGEHSAQILSEFGSL